MVVQEVFFLATQGGADVLGLGSSIGNFTKGKVRRGSPANDLDKHPIMVV